MITREQAIANIPTVFSGQSVLLCGLKIHINNNVFEGLDG